MTFFVSPTGDDRNPGTAERPFQTVARARDEVRQHNQQMTGDLVVMVRGGMYRFAEPLAFGPRDGGANGHRVIYRASPGETPTWSGGQRLEGWVPDRDGRWRAPTKLADFRQLYVNGRRAVRARGQLPEVTRIGESEYRTSLGALAEWRNVDHLEFCYEVVWCHTRCRVASVRRDGTGAIVTMQEPYFRLARRKEGVHVELPTYVENALELLTEPGQWYLDRRAGTVYYRPLPGEDLTKAEIVAPALETLVRVEGTLDQPVADLSFEGICFAEAGWLEPSAHGLVDVQANFVMAADEELKRRGLAMLERKGWLLHAYNEQVKSPANVVCRTAHRVRFEGCRFTRLGGAGLDLERGCADNVVNGCEFDQIASTAIQVGDVLREDHHPADPRLIVRNNTVSNSYIHDVAGEYLGGVGVFYGYTKGTRIVHNEFCRLPYSAVHGGWGWGELDAGGNDAYYQPSRFATPTPMAENLIEGNYIHHVMQRLNDGGGIYLLSRQPGTVIRGNHLHDNPGQPGGIYLDEGTADVEVTGNVVYRVPKAMNFNNHSQNRIASCPVHDNWFDVTPDRPEFPRAVVAAAGRPQPGGEGR